MAKKYQMHQEIQDINKNYIGRIVSRDKWFSWGEVYFAEVEDIRNQKIKRKKIGKTWSNGNYPLLIWHIKPQSIEFKKEGLEVIVKEGCSRGSWETKVVVPRPY